MKKYWAAAPKAVRRIVIAGFAALGMVVPLQLLVLYRTVTQLSEQLTTMDPFAVLSGSTAAAARPGGEAFAAGFSTSGAATLGALAIVAATRLAVPYRNRALRTVQLAGIGHLLLGGATVIGVLIGNRTWDPVTAGTVASVVWVLPVVALSFHRLVRAWSAPFTPPPPDLGEHP